MRSLRSSGRSARISTRRPSRKASNFCILGKFNLTVTDIINAIQSQNVQPQSPKKREFFKYLPETIGYFAPELHKFGVYRLTAGSRKHAIGGPFCEY